MISILLATTIEAVFDAAHLFDREPTQALAKDFLEREGHHLLIAHVDGEPAGIVSGIELVHPDKGVEMLLYELFVDEPHRRQGIGRSLTVALAQLAQQTGCRGMWAPVDHDDDIATATYRSAGSRGAEPATIQWWDFNEILPS